jgi:hypothetical protein
MPPQINRNAWLYVMHTLLLQTKEAPRFDSLGTNITDGITHCITDFNVGEIPVSDREAGTTYLKALNLKEVAA